MPYAADANLGPTSPRTRICLHYNLRQGRHGGGIHNTRYNDTPFDRGAVFVAKTEECGVGTLIFEYANIVTACCIHQRQIIIIGERGTPEEGGEKILRQRTARLCKRSSL